MLNQTNSQSINLSGLLKNMKWWQATIMICSILLASGYAASQGVNVSVNVDLQGRIQAIESKLDIPVNSSLSAFVKSNTFMVSLVDAYACLMNGSNAHLIEYLTNHTQLIDDALDNSSVSGGSVYVAAGNYTAPGVTVQNNTRLIIDNGATGITYTIASGATCIIHNFNGFDAQYYSAGVITADFNMTSGNLQVLSVNMTSAYVYSQIFVHNLNVTDLLANPYVPYGYYIGLSGLTYYLKNGTTQAIDQRSTDFSQVANSASGNLTQGGLVYLGAGYFNESTVVNSTYPILWKGQGAEATIISLNPNSNCTMMDFNPTGYPDPYHEGFAGLENLKIEGNKGQQTSVQLTGVHLSSYAIDFHVTNVFVENVSGWGFVADTLWGGKYNNLVIEVSMQDGFLANGTNSFATGNSTRSGDFVGCRFAMNTFDGLHLVHVNMTSITDCEIQYNFYRGLELDNASCQNVMQGGYIHGNSMSVAGQADGIVNNGQYNKFIGVDFDGTGRTGLKNERYAYLEGTTGLDNVVTGCTFNSTSYNIGAGFITTGGYYSSIQNNPGLNPFGKIATPFPSYLLWYPNITICGFTNRGTLSTLPQPGGLTSYSWAWGYMAQNTPLIFDITGGSADVNVTIRDQNNIIISVLGASPLHDIYLPVGCIINFGNYTTAPTVIVCGT